MRRQIAGVFILAAFVACTLLVLNVATAVAGKPHVKAAKGVPLVVKTAGSCSALAPADWSISTNPQASTVELLRTDKSMYAGWAVAQINRAMQPYYGDFYGDPETSLSVVTNLILKSELGDGSGMHFTSSPQPFLNYFSLRSFVSHERRGLVFYKIYPVAWPQMYVESAYWAISDKSNSNSKQRIASGVVVSIRCVTQLIPVPGAGAGERGGEGGKDERAGCGTGGALRGYQKELGTQYAHSPTTGQNFLLDPTTDWLENGPQGAGYYRAAGNSYEKLELGRDDDC